MKRVWTILDEYHADSRGFNDSDEATERDLEYFDRLMEVLRELKPATHPPCCDECDGKTGENVDPDYYCAAGTPWLHHADLAIVDGISGENAITDAQAAALARLARPCDLDADERGAIDDETGQRLR